MGHVIGYLWREERLEQKSLDTFREFCTGKERVALNLHAGVYLCLYYWNNNRPKQILIIDKRKSGKFVLFNKGK